jgi:tetratricopeptide (TPR) repeat protein
MRSKYSRVWMTGWSAVICLVGGLAPAIASADDGGVVARLAEFGRMPPSEAAKIVSAVNRGLAENAARGGFKYDRVRERVGRTMFSDPGKSRAEYQERLGQVLGRMRSGLDVQTLESIFPRRAETTMECVTDFPLTMVACDALVAAASRKGAVLPYTPPNMGAELEKELTLAGAPKNRAEEVAAALRGVMLSAGRTLANDPRARDLGYLMRACPGSFSKPDAQIRAWNLGPTVGMARCIAVELAKRGAAATFATQLLFGMEKEAAQAYLLWGAPSAVSASMAAESMAAGVSVDNVLKVARAHYQAGHFSQAAAAYEQAVRMDPESSRAYAGLASARTRLGDLRGAIAALNSAVRVNAGNANLHVMLGDAHGAAGAPDSAQGAYRAALKLEPTNAKAKAGLHAVLHAKAIAEAKALRIKARTHFAAKQFKIAQNAYQKATELDPENAGGYAGLGSAKLAMKDFGGAVEAYLKATALSPKNSVHWTQLATAQGAMGEKAAAVKSLERALALDPKNARAKAGMQELTQTAAAAAESGAEGDSLVDSLLNDPLLEASDGAAGGVADDAATASVESIEGDAAAPSSGKDPLLDSLVAGEPDAPPPAAKPVAAPAPKTDVPPKEAGPAPTPAPETADGAAPGKQETPTRDDVVTVLKPLQSGVKSCVPGVHGVITAAITVEGKTGKVIDVEITKAPAGVEARAKQCVVNTVKTGVFPVFEKDVFQIAFPYSI